jgi:hypothetical protein
MLLRDHNATGAMESGAVDQPGLEVLELLTGNDMVMNVDDHNETLSVLDWLLTIRDRGLAARRDKRE